VKAESACACDADSHDAEIHKTPLVDNVDSGESQIRYQTQVF
jgi:hypothetical protein